MAAANSDLRKRAFGQDYSPTAVDRFGVYLSARRMRSAAGGFTGRRVADVGCGYHAEFARTLLDEVQSLTLIDVGLHADLKAHPKVRALEGYLPEVLAELGDASCDVLMCNSVVEHLWEPDRTLTEFRRITAPGGVALINVPSWRGKRFLELSAYRLHLSPPEEMDDHKTYYDPRDLWPLLVRAGFSPRHIRCFTHKFGLNTFAICRLPAGGGEDA
jgi:SAM-dependent methyltransferase